MANAVGSRQRDGSILQFWPKFVLVGVAGIVLSACAGLIDIVGNAVSATGTAYSSDTDPRLVREALPFGLKTYESLLERRPEHPGLLLASARGFTAYAFLIQTEIEQRQGADRVAGGIQRARVKRLYLRGRDYAFRGLEAAYPGFVAGLSEDLQTTLARTEPEDAALLYWAGAAWSGALAVDKGDLHLLADLPTAAALVSRVLELDEAFDRGSAHEFFVRYEAARPGGSLTKAREHYRRSLQLSDGKKATIHLALAEAVTIKEQNLREFEDLLNTVLSFEPTQYPEYALVNTLARERAVWLQSRISEFFLTADEPRRLEESQ